jgi:lysophospholipase L1-like esterase
MKVNCSLHENRLALVTALLLAATALVTAQDARTPADVSHFPPLSELPGKPPTHVWPGLPGTWAKCHEHWQTNAANESGAVVFLGDSITQGWTTLAADFPKLKVANRGIGGDITSGVLYRLNADVLSLKPAAIVLLIGTNDVGDDSDPEDVAANTRLILEAIKGFNPKLKVVICKIMPRADGKPGRYTAKIQKINALVEEYVKTQPNFVLCDTWKILADENGNPNPAAYKPDMLHLVPAGYAAWKVALEPVIVSLKLETAPVK